MAGNLLDNAMEAVAMPSILERQIWFQLEETAKAITVEVATTDREFRKISGKSCSSKEHRPKQK